MVSDYVHDNNRFGLKGHELESSEIKLIKEADYSYSGVMKTPRRFRVWLSVFVPNLRCGHPHAGPLEVSVLIRRNPNFLPVHEVVVVVVKSDDRPFVVAV